MKAFFSNLLSRLMPFLTTVGQTVVWQRFLMIFGFIILVVRLFRDKSWKVFSAYFFIIVINIVLYGILQTDQIKENSKIFFNETDWLRWGIFIFSICAYVFANHLVLIAIAKYSIEDMTMDMTMKVGKWNINLAFFASIGVILLYLFYINQLIVGDGSGSLIFSITVSILAFLVINLLLTKTSSFTNTSIWHFFNYFDITHIKFVKEIPKNIKNDLWLKFILIFIGTGIYILLTIANGKQKVIEMFSSQSIIFFGFAFFMLFYAEFIIIPKVNQLKFFTLMAILSVLFSNFNDPTAPEYLPRESERQNYKKHFANWVNNKPVQENGTLPLIFVASEGGGIRAMSWTLLTLEFLSKDSQIKDFNKYLYAISGVSGGAVGATFYVSMLKDRTIVKNGRITDSTTTDIIAQDYLSDLVRGNVFRSPVRLFSPFKSSFLDRNKMLENSWAGAYSNLTQSNAFDEPFLKLWSDDKTYDVPSLILNGTFAETGQKAIISNIDFSDASKLFQIKNVVDLYSLLDPKNDFPTKTATSLSARFPVITSGGLIEDVAKKKSGHITDGGYHDNTGIETCIQIINLLKPEIAKIELERNIKIKPYIFFLKNGMNMDPNKIVNAGKIAYEGASIVQSFYNSWDRSAEIKNSIYSELLADSKSDIGYVLIELKRKDGDFPLGWQLSRASINNMKSLMNQCYNLKNITFSQPKPKPNSLIISVPVDTVGINTYKNAMIDIREQKVMNLQSPVQVMFRTPANTVKRKMFK